MSGQERIIDPQTQALIKQIKVDPSSFIPTKEELDEVIKLREEADRQLKKSGKVVILGSYE